MGILSAEDSAERNRVQVDKGIVMPRRHVMEAIEAAMKFLKKADGNYIPGKIDGELAGYFTRAHVNEDGSRAEKQLAFPARQHAYFIFTFLRYHAYAGEKEWLLRARDLAEWNLAHSTPPDAFYPHLPYSTFSNGKPGGSQDKDSIEPDKSAFLGSAYLALNEATSDTRYLDAAKAIADTLVRRQNKDGSWHFRVAPEDGAIRQEFGGAPVFFVQFFEDMIRHVDNPSYRQAHDRALKLMLERNIGKNLWGTYHEDIRDKPQDYLSAEPMSFTAIYLFRHAKAHPEYLEMGRRILRSMEERLVHTEGHPAAPAPAVSEQAGFEHMMPGHTARYCLALAEFYKVTGEEQTKKKAISGINALTYMQSETGLFRTFFQLRNEKRPRQKRPNWYSQHLYTVCHVLEAMPILPAN
ncbi:AGE family epimerase/isomerase [Candidatus Sumerlaeota bacterium]|nr:AGE family epimerase/isomerase [Candidatus Sumerlaeota bacterium]